LKKTPHLKKRFYFAPKIRFMKKIVILGAGESGVGAALLAKQKGFDVFVSDKNDIKENFRLELEKAEIPYESGQHTEGVILAAAEIIKSPGIPDKAPLIKAAKEKGISIIGEIEFAYRYLEGSKIIAITGSNGKTTTTSLTYHILKTAGLDVAVGGNIGKSFARLLAEEKPYYIYVLELSSFQLDDIKTFQPYISMLLNITPDHLDRYDYKMQNYVASKFRITKNQTEDDIFIFNEDDKEIKQFMDKNPVQANEWGISTYFEGEILRGRFDMSKTPLRGPHNYFNASCAISAAIVCGVGDTKIQRGLETFVNAPHRLENVATIDGIEFINDSKATNVDSVFWALKAMSKPTILILGGQDKGNDYTQIAALVKEKVIAVVGMGVDNQKIINFFKTNIDTKSMKEALDKSVAIAQKYLADKKGENTEGVTILLSPACASFDLFKNYEDRGDQFKKEVLALRS
jgi:UDP-N-acetylmuramoylalanine--D-glutamate ligase